MVTWIGATLYFSITSPTISEDTSKYTTPIPPSFDTQTMEQVGSRISVPIDLSETAEYILPPNTEIQESTISAEVEESSNQIEEPI